MAAHVALIAALMVSRRPDAVLHPQFWAEDGKIFYHDAYMRGAAALWQPLNGYLQILPRLGALLTAQAPLAWAPALFAGIAFVVQLLPVALLLSRRMATALPSDAARLAMAYAYAALPNSYELNLNLTNAQWHLAAAAFLVLAGHQARVPRWRGVDAALLILAGLTGPFCIFLAPVAWFEYRRERAPARLANALVMSAAAIVQAALLLTTAGSERGGMPVDPSFDSFFGIICNNLVLGGLAGDRLMTVLLQTSFIASGYFAAAATCLGLAMILYAVWTGPVIYREGAFFAACILTAALITPNTSHSAPQWPSLTAPGHGMRYLFMPTLAWLATLLVLGSGRLRAVSCGLAAVFVAGACFNWVHPPYAPTGFNASAAAFQRAPPGATMSFPENPPGWNMTLTKQ